MKLLSFTLLIACLIHACSFQSAQQNQRQPIHTLSEPPCASGAFVVQEQPDAPARLTIADARCNGPQWTARLTLKNSSDKVITAYDIADTGTYEHKKNVESSQRQSGLALSPGSSIEIKSGGGFRDGLSYGKPTGAIQGTIFRITRIEFADGSVWQQNVNSLRHGKISRHSSS